MGWLGYGQLARAMGAMEQDGHVMDQVGSAVGLGLAWPCTVIIVGLSTVVLVSEWVRVGSNVLVQGEVLLAAISKRSSQQSY